MRRFEVDGCGRASLQWRPGHSLKSIHRTGADPAKPSQVPSACKSRGPTDPSRGATGARPWKNSSPRCRSPSRPGIGSDAIASREPRPSDPQVVSRWKWRTSERPGPLRCQVSSRAPGEMSISKAGTSLGVGPGMRFHIARDFFLRQDGEGYGSEYFSGWQTQLDGSSSPRVLACFQPWSSPKRGRFREKPTDFRTHPRRLQSVLLSWIFGSCGESGWVAPVAGHLARENPARTRAGSPCHHDIPHMSRTCIPCSRDVAVHTPKANVQCTTAGGKALKSARNRHQTDMLMNTLYN